MLRALRRAGLRSRPGGKHTIITDRDDHFLATMPNSSPLALTTLRKILGQCGVSVERFRELY